MRIVARCTCSSCARTRVGHGLRERELGVRLQPGERRAQLVRGVGEEALLVAAGLGDLAEQLVQRRDQRARLFGRVRRSIGAQVARRARADLVRQPLPAGASAALDAEPDDRERRGSAISSCGSRAREQDVARQARRA